MSQQKVAVVTGSNKGIGYAIVKGLCEKFDGVVFLTSRDEGRGKAAVKSLNDLGFKPQYHQLDVLDLNSIETFKNYLKSTFGGLDVLVNNAGIAIPIGSTVPISYQAETILATNYFGLLNVCNGLFPLLKNNGVVVNISSSYGYVSRIPSDDLRKQLSNDNLTVSGLNELMKKFVSDAKDGTHENNGWGNLAYAVSKVGVSALTRIQQRNFDAEQPLRNISVNSVHPGSVDTDMSDHKGTLTIEEGAKAPLYLVFNKDNLKGQYVWQDCRVLDWINHTN